MQENVIELYAWIGEDELGSGEVGLKQALVPAGCIPLVSIKRDKIDREYILQQLRSQAARHRKTIKLVRFVMAEEIKAITP